MTDPNAFIPVAAIARPHGVKGEVRLKLFNDSDVLLHQDEVLIRASDGEEHEVSVTSARRADDAILMKLHSVDDRNRADDLRGALICVRRKDFPPLADGEFYAIDAVGAEVKLGGARVGEVTEIVTYPTVDAMYVKTGEPEGDWEIPLSDAYIVKVDTDARVVEISTLAELDRIPLKRKKEPKERRPRRWEREKGSAAVTSTEASSEGASTTTTTAAAAPEVSSTTSDDAEG